MDFYSHVKEENEKRIGRKLLKNHLSDVYQKAIFAFNSNIDLGFTHKKLNNAIHDLAFFHDLGKYTSFFQDYLFKRKKVDKNLRQHSRIGAFAVLNKYKHEPLLAIYLYFIVLNHHSSFDDIMSLDIRVQKEFCQTLKMLFEKQKSVLLPVLPQIQNEIKNTQLAEFIQIPETKEYRRKIKRIIKKTAHIRNYFTINYLFSLLIEADKLDASETNQYRRKALNDLAVENFIGKTELSQFPSLDINQEYKQNTLRNYVRAAVLENLKQDNILEKRIFTLTAPTGIGKTLTSLDFALRLKKMIREKEHFEPQIIYGLPFINIIEQGLKVYSEEVFQNEIKNDNINILAHYQYADVFAKEKNRDNNEKYNQRLMALNTWQADIVITSFVQFFETLISNRNKMLLKFNHLAGAIVILDEVQTLRLKQLPLLGSVLYFLSKFLHTRLILMTATKPKIFELANKEILIKENEKAEPEELLKENETVFKMFNRTKIVPLIKNTLVNCEDFYEIFAKKRPKNKSCLVVCNTVQRSIDVFNELKKNEISPIYYLSTNVVPAERMYIIDRIKLDLKYYKAPVLVSTQVVEAGVDLDFDMGFRDLAPIDSIVQVAGRINRENSKEREGSPLFIIEFEREYENSGNRSECEMVYDKLTRSQVVKALESKSEIIENDYLQLIDKYFSDLSDNKSFYESRAFFESMKTLKYDTDNKEDKDEFPVSKFQIIEYSPWARSVFVELNEEAKQAREAYRKLLNDEIEKEEFDKHFKRTFHQHIIAVPDVHTCHLPNINEFTEKILLVPFSKINDFYDKETGFIREGRSEGKVLML